MIESGARLDPSAARAAMLEFASPETLIGSLPVSTRQQQAILGLAERYGDALAQAGAAEFVAELKRQARGEPAG